MTATRTTQAGLEWVVSFAAVWILLYTPPGIVVFAFLSAIVDIIASRMFGVTSLIPLSMLFSFVFLVLAIRFTAVPIVRRMVSR